MSLVSLISDLLAWIDCDTALASPPDGIISITATGQTLQIDTVLLSYAFSATNGLRITWDGMSTATATLRIPRLPIQCNPLFFRKTLATAGQCIFCLFDSNLPPITRFYQFLDKRSWKEHLQKHFGEQEEGYSRLQRLSKNKAVTCPDPRCALSFDSTRDFQFHCQDVHCVDRVKEPTANKRRCTPRSKVDAIPDLYPNLESKHDYAFIEEKLPSRCASKITDTLALEPIGLVYPVELIEPDDQSDGVRSLASSAYSANSKFSETNWHSRGAILDVGTPASSVISDSFIDPRLRDNSISIASSTQ